MRAKLWTINILVSGKEFTFTPETRRKPKIGEVMDLFVDRNDDGNEIIYAQAEVIEFPSNGSPLYRAKVL